MRSINEESLIKRTFDYADDQRGGTESHEHLQSIEGVRKSRDNGEEEYIDAPCMGHVASNNPIPPI